MWLRTEPAAHTQREITSPSCSRSSGPWTLRTSTQTPRRRHPSNDRNPQRLQEYAAGGARGRASEDAKVGRLGPNFDDAFCQGCGKLFSRVELELPEDAREVSFDCPRRDEQRLRDLTVGQAVAGVFGDAALAGCE